ncbi:MAG: bifunctional (p)ppGpp synthetase/guanosine-3',5'-bis(diphosphate) 3'-pyrophosphohydrolase [Clostridiales bacterium]|jgi:GTP pyrophosphokinase|nr:bifunctional (p)ppGpp synthetase/guanosine-3',5'-bis(diphosphate) 3'-pyrophosphohydrolase [Clostridiales bacterium]
MPDDETRNLNDKEIFDKLIARMRKYHPSSDFSRVEKAYLYAKSMHGSQLRKSGEPYIIHPLSVAFILADLNLDTETIIAALLHDVIEDTKATREDIVREFSEEVALLVDGVTKLEKTDYRPLEEEQAENYRKMFLSTAKDIRIILIKAADRLHNLRTLKYMSPEKQKLKAQETLDIYAPLIHRLGISRIRYELEDLSFRYINPGTYYDLRDKIVLKQSERKAYIDGIVADLQKQMKDAGLANFHIDGRPKHFFSIYKKMVSQDKSLDQIYDLFAVRIIVDTVGQCYQALGVVHREYTPIQGRFKDYISTPKRNIYRSLHTTVLDQSGEPFEVQIRTFEMHRESEYGVAAHWRYKTGKLGGGRDDKSSDKIDLLRRILEWQQDMTDNREFLEALKSDLDVYKEDIYCYTPSGELVTLTKGSTTIDFAYSIHTALGNRMVGARVNGRIVPIDTRLTTGDRVEIITSQNAPGPKLAWLQIVKTSQARGKIRQWFKHENRGENISHGRALLEKGASHKGFTLAQLATPERVEVTLGRYNFSDWDSLLASVGVGGLKENQVINRLYDEYLRETAVPPTDAEIAESLVTPENPPSREARRREAKHSGVFFRDVGDVSVKYARCCGPLPGDEIIGFVTRGRGVSVHRTDCVNVINMSEEDRHRILEVTWAPDARNLLYRTGIRIIGRDRRGLLGDISKVLFDRNINVRHIEGGSVRDGKTMDVAIINVVFDARDKAELDNITRGLLSVGGVDEIERVTY